ncbi:hypothetical protein GOBAR_AA33320 [Gossypium barbadense]|uniref:Uncharacterized protein n=1 Tax=Gossypium barbadense TaxID=3634 RepID=A0A2P5W8D9_GOSBA|nr:hypothetical protein GOBAR_AA33320 [Gossypium barbadense]
MLLPSYKIVIFLDAKVVVELFFNALELESFKATFMDATVKHSSTNIQYLVARRIISSENVIQIGMMFHCLVETDFATLRKALVPKPTTKSGAFDVEHDLSSSKGKTPMSLLDGKLNINVEVICELPKLLVEVILETLEPKFYHFKKSHQALKGHDPLEADFEKKAV